MIIKVCGMREADNIRAVEALGVDWIGLIFWPGSSRYVSERPAYLPLRARRVGVFVDAPVDAVLQHVSEYRLDIVQLHGHEDREYIRELRQPDGDHFSVMKAISVRDDSDIATYKQYEDSVDYFLFDTKCKTVGGSGQQFDWSVLSGYDGSRPFLLSGGIGPDSCERLRAFHHPRLAGIDLNSRFEVSPALKDISQLKQFLYEQNQSTLC